MRRDARKPSWASPPGRRRPTTAGATAAPANQNHTRRLGPRHSSGSLTATSTRAMTPLSLPCATQPRGCGTLCPRPRATQVRVSPRLPALCPEHTAARVHRRSWERGGAAGTGTRSGGRRPPAAGRDLSGTGLQGAALRPALPAPPLPVHCRSKELSPPPYRGIPPGPPAALA